MKTYTLTELIAESYDGAEFSEDRQFMEVTFEYSGYSIDMQDDDGRWQEVDFITQDFILRDDNCEAYDYKSELPYRAHGYSCFDWYRFKLPPNRKAGTRYTVAEIGSWCVNDELSLRCHGGFDYYNMPEEE